MQIHWSLNCRRLHYSTQFSSTFTAFSLVRICLKVNLCKIHSAIHGVTKMQNAHFLQWGKFSFGFLSVTPSLILYFFNTHVQGVAWNVCVSCIQYLLRIMLSGVGKGKNGQPWNLPSVRMYQMMFTSVWASN